MNTPLLCKIGLHKKRWTPPNKGHREGCHCDILAAYDHCGQDIVCARCGKEFPFNDHWSE